MSQSQSDHPGPALLAHEARVSYGPVPRELSGRAMPPGSSLLHDESYLLRTTSGYGLYYRKGAGITVEREPQADPVEENLWVNGSVYAAIAAIHGYLPFHASAVVWNNQVYAFSGPSGAGKSTLAAALGRHGLPLFCDDTLVLDVSGQQQIWCLPGHKRLKLTPQAIALTGSQAEERVAPTVEKNYARPPAGTVRSVLPLARLTFLEDSETFAIDDIVGANRIARINDDHYTAELYTLARGESLPERFARIAGVAARVPMQVLRRPREVSRFDAVCEQVAKQIIEGMP
jgi:hypothetical protein